MALQIVEDNGEKRLSIYSLNYNFAVFNGVYENGKVITPKTESFSDQTLVFFVSLDDYNRITGNTETHCLEGEVLVNTTKNLQIDANSIEIEGGKTFVIRKEIDKFLDTSIDVMNMSPPIYLVTEIGLKRLYLL